MNIREAAALSGISVRTLHHYDQIALLRPARHPVNGYRDYSTADLDRLQQILFFRECGFSLGQIGRLLDSPGYDRGGALALQRKYLLHEKNRIDAMLATLDKTIQASKGEIFMSNTDKFKGFDFSSNPYEEEARELWGDAAVDKSGARIASLSETGRACVEQEMDDIFTRLAGLRHEDPSSESVQQAVGGFYQYLNVNFGNQYSPEAFAGLGELYVQDERFTRNIDQFGEGLSAFLAKAMALFAEGA